MTKRLITPAMIAEKLDKLPSMPVVLGELRALTQDEIAVAADYERVIRKDIGLTVALLRLANSASFALKREVKSIEHAVSVLGMGKMYELALCAAFSRVMPPKLRGYGITSRTFWEHNVATCLLAERIAKRTGACSSEDAFTCALFHDCGKLVLTEFMDDESEAIAELLESGMTITAAEKELFGMGHEEAGAIIAEAWQLPKSFADAARYHHHPLEAPADADTNMIGIIHLASCLAHQFGYGADIGSLQREMVDQVRVNLGLKRNDIEAVFVDSIDAIQNMSNLV